MISPVTNGEIVLIKEGNIEDFYAISPEMDSENLRMVGALGEMLFEQAKKSFRADSLLVVLRNEDYRIAMFPRGGGIAVWKTSLEEDEILQALRRRKNDQEEMVHIK